VPTLVPHDAAHDFAPPRFSALGRYFEISLYLLLLVSILTLVSTGKLDLVSIFLAPAALLVKGYRWWRGRPPELSHRGATWLVAAYLIYFPFDLWWVSRLLATDAQNPRLYSALLAAIHLMLFAMIVRLYSASALRDYLFLALLAFSSMLASAILTVGSMFLGFFLVFLALAISTFIGLEMRRSAEGATSPPLESGTAPARQLHRALGITSGAIALSALVAGGAIFFVLPRFNAGYLSGFNLQPTLISGFTDDVELGEIGQIKLSSAVVMRIKVDGPPAAMHDLRWRGIALTTFDGRRWFTEGHDSVGASTGADGWISLHTDVPDRSTYLLPLHYTVFLEPMASDAIFVMAEPARIRGDLGPDGPGVRRSFVTVDKTGSLSNPFHNYGNVRYEAVSAVPQIPLDALRASSTAYTPAMREMYLQLPRLDARIPALAKQITARARNPYDQARAIETYLHSHYGYTLDLAAASPPADPLAYFLFERRAGHCEYFAAAMTVMMRSLGVPARYINGFLPGEYNDLGGDYIVRAHDAHSWVEVYFPKYGWLAFDPTPSSEEAAPGFFARLGLYGDYFELQWSEWIVNYDFLHQYTLAQGVGRASRDWTALVRAKFADLRTAGVALVNNAQERVLDVPPWVPVLVAALGTALIFWRSAGLRERLTLAWRLRAGNGPLPPHAAALFYLRTLRLLERRGWKKSPWQTPLEFAASLPSGDLTDAVTQLTETYQSARFGGRSADPGRVAALLARIDTALRTAPSPH
jgi:protein-glutamine gamma-glutamyltransferase